MNPPPLSGFGAPAVPAAPSAGGGGGFSFGGNTTTAAAGGLFGSTSTGECSIIIFCHEINLCE